MKLAFFKSGVLLEHKNYHNSNPLSLKLIRRSVFLVISVCLSFSLLQGQQERKDIERKISAKGGQRVVESHEFGESKFFSHASGTFLRVVEEPSGLLLVAAAPEKASAVITGGHWFKFCKDAGWDLVVISIESDTGSVSASERGSAEKWLERQVFNWLDGEDSRSELQPTIPIYAMFLDSASDWLFPIVFEYESRIPAWVASGSIRFPRLPINQRITGKSSALSAGLLIASSSGRNRPYWDYMTALRKSDVNRRVAYLPWQENRVHPSYHEEFAQEFLKKSATLELEEGVWLRYLDGAILTFADLENGQLGSLADYIWFPDREMAGAWKALALDRPSEPEFFAKISSRVIKNSPFFRTVGFHYNILHGEPRALLVVAINSNRPQWVFQNDQWVAFAKKMKWALMVVNLQDKYILSHNRASDWFESCLFNQIDERALRRFKGIPIVMHAEGKPAYWMQRIIVRNPERFIAWSVVGAPRFATVPANEAMPPGLLVAPKASMHFSHLFFLQDLRKAHKANRVCLLARDDELLKRSYIDGFSQNFLEEATNRKNGNGFWLRYRDGKRLTLVDANQGVDPADYLWFPNEKVAGLWNLFSRVRPEIPFPRIVKKTVMKTGLEELPDLNLFVRLPGRSVRKESPEPVKGVICFCTWQREDTTLINHLKKPDDPLMMFADRNNLAVITWNTASMLPAGKSIRLIDADEKKEVEAKFDRFGKVWSKGIEKVCRDNDLPSSDFLLHGFSRGSFYANRLALNYPEKFLAVNTHIGSSYRRPTRDASNIIWLVTTGENDGGYLESREFFSSMQESEYPALIKAGPGLGHSMREDIENLYLAFFQFALDLRDTAKERRNDPKDVRDKSITAAELFREKVRDAGYFGDFFNHDVYRNGEGDFVPEKQRIMLPTEDIASAWGAEPHGGM